MSSESRIRTVLLTLEYSTRSSYYLDWAEAFECSPLFGVTTFNIFAGGERRAARRAIEGAELVVALHACSADTLEYLKPLSGALQRRRGRFLAFVGNEYNLPWARLADKRDFLRQTAPDWIGTQLPLEAGRWLYADTGAQVLALPHALNDAVFRRDKPEAARPIDIGGRSARYPVFVGDDERNRVHDRFAALAPKLGLRVDIDTENRLDRPGWAGFLNDCRGTIGTEAGSWYLERDDRTALAVRDYVRARTGGRAIRADGMIHRMSRRLPYRVKSWLRAGARFSPVRHEAIDDGGVSFAEIEKRFFAGRPRCPAYSKCISSRHFDAAGTGTCQILVRGRYNDILTADEHYIPVDPDLGNVEEAVARFSDPAERRRIADAAFALAHDRHT
ncbi:MAG: glycosyltransferase, partial [Stellaceae bacterium]